MIRTTRRYFLMGLGVLASLIPVGGSVLADTGGDQPMRETQQDLGAGGNELVRLLFIHHSCGGQLMADIGPRQGGERGSGARCIYVSHPNGGGLRSRLEEAGFAVHEASYGSTVGEDTDICHWHKKFRDQMDAVLHTKRQDEKLTEGEINQIVAFKSCYPNNRFVGKGTEPGDPDSCELTLANAKAAYRSLLPLFQAQPEVLFVAFTAPPQAEPKPVVWKATFKSWFKGNPNWAELAREFNAWLVARENGWLSEYALANVVVFDHYDVLTDHGKTNWSAYPTLDGRDSHPSSEGNQKAATEFVPFVNTAYQVHQQALGGE